jgi:hypothetical protein
MRITEASGWAMNPRGGTVHRGGEKLEFVRFMASWRGRCAPEVEGGPRAPNWLLGGDGEVARWAVIVSSTRRQW